MSGALLLVAAAFVAGLPIAALVDRRADLARLAGEALLFGLGLIAAGLLALMLVGLQPTRASMLLVPFAVAALCIRPGVFRDRATLPSRHAGLAIAIVAFAAVLLAGYALFATIAPMWENDFIADWGMKGRAFFEAGAIDWRVLENAVHHDAHPSYPIFLPLSFDAEALMNGAWDDRALGVLYVAWAAGLLLVAFSLAARESDSLAAGAFAALVLVPFAATPWVGIGEGPLVAYAIAGALLLRGDAPPAAGALLLGVAASFKNEGLLFIAAAAVGLVVAGQARKALRLWPALVIALPWIVVSAAHPLPSIGWAGRGEIVQRLLHPLPVVASFGEMIGKPLYWIGVLVAVMLTGAALVREERFVLAVVVIVFAAYLAAAFVSPFPVEHGRWGGERLVSHLTPLVTFVLLMHLVRRIRPATP